MSRPIMRCLFDLPMAMAPFEGRPPGKIAELLVSAGVNGVVKAPHERELVDALRAAGIRVYAEMACFAGKAAWEKFPGSRPVTATGTPFDTEGGYGGVCPCHPGHLHDLFERVEHLLEAAAWDGLWLDFIRWPGRWELREPPLVDLCFCENCLRRFRSELGLRWPAGLDATADKAMWILQNHAAAWAAWKCDCIVEVVAGCRAIMRRRLGPSATLGIFGVPMGEADFDEAVRRTFGQDWAKLSRVVDVFSPMVYHLYCGRERSWISEVTAEVADRSGRPVWPIVQSVSTPVEMTADEFEKALHEGLRPPAEGIMVFSTRHTIGEDKWDVMARVYREAREH